MYINNLYPGPWFKIKMSYQYRNSFNVISFIGKMTTLYWFSLQFTIAFDPHWFRIWLALEKRQAITWTNNYPVLWRIYMYLTQVLLGWSLRNKSLLNTNTVWYVRPLTHECHIRYRFSPDSHRLVASTCRFNIFLLCEVHSLMQLFKTTISNPFPDWW